ncbi:MAG: EAL domain-containing protein [Piscinibacter sp.]|uniref:putative bifunctional diguanylate cyclase/phosphodiesterase n=1 Tax=Piscinibacter TaxID=1114981 RepID=UPI000FDE6ED1|nr:MULTISPECIES: EAL domain-containing protein [Piscinibacter]MCW5662205.1 EAL domain-containing protein [Piscinibacter sp.]
MLIAACFVVTACLLWLAGEVSVAASMRPRRVARAGVGAALLLAAGGLWWPAHALPMEGTLAAAGGAWNLVVWLPGLALAALGAAAARAIARQHWLGTVGAAAALLAVAYSLLMLALPGLFRLGGNGLFSVGLAVLALAVAMVGLFIRLESPAAARVLRATAALVAAGVLALGSAIAASSPAVGSGTPFAVLAVLAALAGVAGVLLAVLRQPDQGQAPELPVRQSRLAIDGLTGLPTRLFFEERLAQAAKRCDAKRSKLAVLFVDLDGFKPVNDSFGHSCGDRVLEQVGARLKAFGRGGDVVARVGGDEFLLLLPGVSSTEVLAQAAQGLIESLSRPYKVEDREIGISCSVGIAVYPDGCDAAKLIARADVAMYAAKRAGGTRHAFYTAAMDSDAQQNFDMMRDLRQALANNELELFFQPKIDARSGKVTAAEALVRWQHPSRGMVMPGQFIPLAERSGLIGPLGNWVIEAACKQARAWRDKGLRMRVAINVSAYQMRQEDLVDRIADALKRHRIRPSLLTLEITETAAMEDTRATQETFRRLGELGVHLSIDDFGTGYSSLAYLRKLPAEELKIDRVFVQDVEHSADARAVVDAVLKLAHALGLKVVAEGVENPRQQQILVELGCDELQGFLFAKPMTARALLLWAIGDRTESAVFRNSLFGETRDGSRIAARTVASIASRAA